MKASELLKKIEVLTNQLVSVTQTSSLSLFSGSSATLLRKQAELLIAVTELTVALEQHLKVNDQEVSLPTFSNGTKEILETIRS